METPASEHSTPQPARRSLTFVIVALRLELVWLSGLDSVHFEAGSVMAIVGRSKFTRFFLGASTIT
jgi:uncharacterized membrane protein YkgB